MENYLYLEGTKEKIADDLIKSLDLSFENEGMCSREEFFEYISHVIDVLEEHYEFLLDDEDFQKDSSRSYGGDKGFLTSNAEYYINIKGGTLNIALSIAGHMLSFPYSYIIDIAQILLQRVFPNIDLGLFKKLNEALGESCIMIEAKLKGKKGIDQNVFSKNHGECVNNHLWCKYREEYQCTCTKEDVSELCKSLETAGLLRKKGRKYYYQDIL